MQILLMGIGRLGGSLLPLLRAAGHEVTPWRRGEPVPPSPLTWLTVSDESVAQVASLVPPEGVLLHASARLGLEVLASHPMAGSLHPLQTFPGVHLGLPNLRGVPAAVAGSPAALASATEVALSLGMIPVLVPGDRRLYHAACVVAGNFSIVLLAEAAALLQKAGVPSTQALSLLAPLVHAGVEHATRLGPAEALTGPFARGDQEAVRAHRQALATHAPDLLPLYDMLGRHALFLASEKTSTSNPSHLESVLAEGIEPVR